MKNRLPITSCRLDHNFHQILCRINSNIIAYTRTFFINVEVVHATGIKWKRAKVDCLLGILNRLNPFPMPIILTLNILV